MRFTLPYHRTLFNSPSGWYKTCLLCDVQFRNTFNINTDCVKRTGPIVGDTPINYGAVNSLPSTNARKPKKASKTIAKDESATISNTKKTNATTTKRTNNKKTKVPSVRSYFTSAELSTSPNPAASKDYDGFFDNNDEFEEFILRAEANTQQLPATDNLNSNYTAMAEFPPLESGLSHNVADVLNDDDDDLFASIPMDYTTISKQNTASREINATDSVQSENWLDDSFSAVFNNDNDFGNDYVWGSAAKNAKISENSNLSRPIVKRQKLQNEESDDWGSGARSTFPAADDNVVKCSGCHLDAKELCVKKDGPNKGRMFYVCPKTNPCKFFQWSDDINVNRNDLVTTSSDWGYGVENDGSWKSNEQATVNCNCNQPAKNLTVRKDGPNKGRSFYACSNRDSSCGFFQWIDENADQEDFSWGSGSSTSSKRKSTKTDVGTTKGRKCGLCRQEGHSRPKCPRKSEF